MTHLELFRRMGLIGDEHYSRTENLGIEIASMLKGLIKALNKK